MEVEMEVEVEVKVVEGSVEGRIYREKVNGGRTSRTPNAATFRPSSSPVTKK